MFYTSNKSKIFERIMQKKKYFVAQLFTKNHCFNASKFASMHFLFRNCQVHSLSLTESDLLLKGLMKGL